MINKVRWSFVRNTAMKTLSKYNLNVAPLPILTLADKIGVAIMTYTEMSKMLIDHGFSADENWVQEHLADGSIDAALLGMRDRLNQYIILYNDDTTTLSIQRIRFTIAHELGHLILKHPFINGISRGKIRKGMSKSEYSVLEKEANLFAQNILIPYPVLKSVDVLLPKEYLQCIFDVSSSALNTALDEFESKPWAHPTVFSNNFRIGGQRLLNEPHPAHGRAIVFNRAFCENCHYYFAFLNSESIGCCPICGKILDLAISSSKETFNFHEKKESETMIYSKFILDENSRAKICPVCQNEEIENDICQICGTYLVNRCSGVNPDETYYRYNSTDFANGDNEGCQHLLSGNARYCPYCGSRSTFFELGILQNYQDEMEQKVQNQHNRNVTPMIAEDSDDNLDFLDDIANDTF